MCRKEIWWLIVAVLISGCASPSKIFSYGEPPPQYWPGPPDVPRFQYVGQIIGEQNFTTSSQGVLSMGTQLLSFVVGKNSARAQKIELQRPQGGAVDAQGRIYITDTSRQVVYRFDTVDGKLDVWEMATPQLKFISPVAVAFGINNEILISDAELGVVVRLNQQGKPLGVMGAGILERPTGLARDPKNGYIYVADTATHQIKIFNDQGDFLKAIGGHGAAEGQFNAPTHLSFAAGQLYVVDTFNARIQVFDEAAKFVRVFGKRGVFIGDLSRPKGIAVDKKGNVYVVESYYDHLLIYNKEGEFLLPIGGNGAGIGQFYLPAGVWIDHNERVYVADMYNGRVVVFQKIDQQQGAQSTTDSDVSSVPVS